MTPNKGPAPEKGSVVKPVYSEREMNCYAITESELTAIGLANYGVTTAFSLGAAMLSLWLDIFKDSSFATETTSGSKIFTDYVQPFSLVLGLCLCGIGFGFVFWRKSIISVVKRETKKPT
jgi:hypothetical protein